MHPVRAIIVCATLASAFQARLGKPIGAQTRPRSSTDSRTRLQSSSDTTISVQDLEKLEEFLFKNYPEMAKLMQRFEDVNVWNKLQKAEVGATIFAPSNAAFREIDEQRYFQLGDVRNSETVGKICGFHCINEPVTKDVLYESGGVVTLEGVLSVGQTKVGDFFGIGGEDDGGVTINGAKIVKSFEVGSSIVHEVDKLVAPEVVWRFLDQTRLPGTTFLRGLFSAIG